MVSQDLTICDDAPGVGGKNIGVNEDDAEDGANDPEKDDDVTAIAAATAEEVSFFCLY